MKKALLFLSFTITLSVNAQVYPFLEDFDAFTAGTNPLGWTYTNPGFIVYADHGTNGSYGLARNLNGSTAQSDLITTPLIGPATATSVLSFDYRIMEAASYPCCGYNLTVGDKLDLYAVSGPLSQLIVTLDMSNHVTDTAWTNMQIPAGALAGQSGNLRFILTRGSNGGDFFLDIDNVGVMDAIAVNENDKSLPILFPNPVGNSELILRHIPDGQYSWKIITTEGKTMKQGEIDIMGETRLGGSLAAGSYFLQLEGVRKNYLLRFVVNN